MNRLDKLRHFLLENDADAIILKGTASLRYFVGFTGDDSLLYVTKQQAILITDSRYTLQAKAEAPDCELLEQKGGLWSALKSLGLADMKIAFESLNFTVADYNNLLEVGSRCSFSGVDLTSLRIIKDTDEIVKINEAVEIADAAFAALLPQLTIGMTEIEAAAILEFEMRKRGSEAVSFPTIVASGERSALPHGLASNKVINKGEFVTFDFGAIVAGYHSDMTRTIIMGKASERQKYLYNVVLEAQLLGIKEAKAGITGKELDQVVRKFITDAGFGDYFGHGLGHGVGLDIHELPIASKRGDNLLCENMVLTVEPGIYLGKEGGVRIEDMIVITTEGCRVLTASNKQLLEICQS
ncbi:MAG TPA: aminopeptidase P family protein [Candidatus Avacidaminococcus intestinavium]|uniref:Aminopeptidase P family protein n=1 Tax=Candidatus Avacidaminococcus intestinavium TaxID=2840684 RepID=A0A9D1MRA2_9FIRM|nr:aminopeptidase P family protein [Candidatus Avacidaminococcus intestinavium]